MRAKSSEVLLLLLLPDSDWIGHVTYVQGNLRILARGCQRAGQCQGLVRMEQRQHPRIEDTVVVEAHREHYLPSVGSSDFHSKESNREEQMHGDLTEICCRKS